MARRRGSGQAAGDAQQTTESIDASPSKTLFIDMLVRDIELKAAIGDLADNAVDGARRAIGDGFTGPRPFKGFYLDITVSEDEVFLKDNCGGISLHDAREYAFKFGRPRGTKGLASSIGQFGVGMKRAFFKLGRLIDLTSVTEESRFALRLPVDEWEESPEWQFVLRDVVDDKTQPKKSIGTTVSITELLPAVSEEVGGDYFPHELLDELAQLHRGAITQGFRLRVNGIRAQARPVQLLEGGGIKPAFQEYDHRNGGAPVRVRIACGVSVSEPGTAGWDVVCNGRTVLRSDQTAVTGWRAGGDVFIPSYHNQFARFRGVASFDSTDASAVPWNTTKTRLNQDSAVWREAKRQMIVMMRPVIDFLNALDREKDAEGAATVGATLGSTVEKARLQAFADVAPNAVFRYPTPRKAPSAGRVTFHRPKSQLEQAKKFLGVSTYREVGEEAFDYWVEAELDDSE